MSSKREKQPCETPNDESDDILQTQKSNFKSLAKKVSMGKKVEKILKVSTSSKTSTSSSSHAANHNQSGGNTSSLSTSNLSFSDQYRCTGKLKEDFENVCQLKNIKYVPEIIPRSKRPGSSTQHHSNQADTAKADKGKAGAKGGKAAAAAAAAAAAEKDNGQSEIDGEAPEAEAPPKTYVLRDPHDYFKPKIQVEMDNVERLDTVTEVHIRGWKIDKPLMEVLQICLPHADRLHTLNLWNCGLDEDTIRVLAAMLPNCHNLKTLIIDGNPLKTPAYQALFYEDNSNVQNLYLRNNQLDDEAMQLIAYGLGDLKRQNTKILNLNLNSNLIGDKGAIALAKALRTNRTLLTLSLANNVIGDEGAKALSDVISKFPLSHEEIVYRRKVFAGRIHEKSLSPVPRRGNDSRDGRPASQKSMAPTTISETKNKKEKSAKKESTSQQGGTIAAATTGAGATQKNPKETLAKTKKDDKPRKDKASIDLKASKTQKPLVKQPGKRSAKEQEEVNSTGEPKFALLEISALTDLAENINDNLWLMGNRNLISLNLSRNNLTDKSIQNFILALQYQKVMIDMHKNSGLGLLRLVITHNKLSYDNENYAKLIEMLKLRDPLYKPPVNNNDPTETMSQHSRDGKESSLGKRTSKH